MSRTFYFKKLIFKYFQVKYYSKKDALWGKFTKESATRHKLSSFNYGIVMDVLASEVIFKYSFLKSKSTKSASLLKEFPYVFDLLMRLFCIQFGHKYVNSTKIYQNKKLVFDIKKMWRAVQQNRNYKFDSVHQHRENFMKKTEIQETLNAIKTYFQNNCVVHPLIKSNYLLDSRNFY